VRSSQCKCQGSEFNGKIRDRASDTGWLRGDAGRRRFGLGEFSETASKEKLERFLNRLPDFREKLAKYYPDPAEQEKTLRELLTLLERKSVAAIRDCVPATS